MKKNSLNSFLEKKLFLIDTNTLSEPLRPEPNQKVLAKIKYHQFEIATAAQVLFEITSGCYKFIVPKLRLGMPSRFAPQSNT